MKIFLIRTVWKITLTFVLFIIASFLWRTYVISTISDTFPLGFPLQFYRAWGPCPPGEICSEFNWLWLAIDIAIWYIFSAFIISAVKNRNIG